MYPPCLATNIMSVIVGAVALRMVMASQYVSPFVYILVAVLFIVGQFLYFTHRFRPVAGTISFGIIILALLLLRAGLGTSPFMIDPAHLLMALVALQITKLPIG